MSDVKKSGPAGNLLADETSPYLLQHKANPVHWRPWGEAALAEAQARNKPILLSVGYAACHWCHVMAHESFEDDGVAAVMNELFINIKVDREERPDIDQIYQHALALLGEQGGWPLTMFLTPRGQPFWGGTYFPKEPRYGRPGFPDVLNTVSRVFHHEPEKIQSNVAQLGDALNKMGEAKSGGAIPLELIDRIAQHLAGNVDRVFGGIGQAPKFPSPYVFELLWRAYLRRRRQDAGLKEAVEVTLDRMSQGGIYDHLGGGFARYSTDAQWLAPHFEKMLYDNAQLIDLLTLVWQETGNPLYAARVAETVDWLKREMMAEGGGFAATLDADSEGEEGKFYVWSEAEIDAALGADAALFKRHYDVAAEGNWEHKNILNRNHRPALADAATEKKLADARAVLLQARAQRIRPGWDDKVLADWNGLMIAALAQAARAFAKPDWLELARGAFAFIAATMQREGRLLHSWRHGVLKHRATLDDYANMIRAAIALHEATGEGAYLEQARAWVGVLDAHYWDIGGQGYFFAADDAADLIVRAKNAHDNAVPSGNGTMLANLARLFYLTGQEDYFKRAEALLTAFSGEVERNFFPLATLLNGVDLLQRAVQVVIVGPPGAGRDALLAAAYGVSQPNRVTQLVPPDATLPANHPAAGKGMAGRQATAYVCHGPSCSAPVSDAAALTALLSGR